MLPLLLHQSANIKNQSNTTIAKNRCPRNDLQANKQLTEGLDNNFLLTDEIINDDTSLAITKVNNNDEDILIDIALSARNTQYIAQADNRCRRWTAVPWSPA